MAMTPDITGGLDCEESRIPRLKPIEESLQKLVQKAFASRGGRATRRVRSQTVERGLRRFPLMRLVWFSST